jgi:hypothetical protein
MIELLGVIADDAARHCMACAVRSKPNFSELRIYRFRFGEHDMARTVANMCAECLEELQNIRLKADR